MSNVKLLNGRKFGRLTVIERCGSTPQNKALWKCRCDCGKYKVVIGSKLLNGETKSCGCVRSEMTQKYNKTKRTHGNSNSRLYRIWHGIKQRTTDSNSKNYCNYGGRGIKICKEWEESFTMFQKWALDNGYVDDLTIDRIDNNGDYCPENCRWIDTKGQANNRRSSKVINYKGENKTLKQWADFKNINYATLKYRIYSGWSIEKALETPVKK